jgi:hypothetical protein
MYIGLYEYSVWLSDFNQTSQVSQQIFKKSSNIKFIYIYIHMMKLTVAFHNFANMPKIGLLPLRRDTVIETCNNHRAIFIVICLKILLSCQLKTICYCPILHKPYFPQHLDHVLPDALLFCYVSITHTRLSRGHLS